ncbi:hypothetical protein ACROYT_G022203 [Oculina patagonica]
MVFFLLVFKACRLRYSVVLVVINADTPLDTPVEIKFSRYMLSCAKEVFFLFREISYHFIPFLRVKKTS